VRVVTGDYGQELTRRDRLAASAPLDELAAELEPASALIIRSTAIRAGPSSRASARRACGRTMTA
jgi:hypothetical protein